MSCMVIFQVKNSNHLEPEGMKAVLGRLLNEDDIAVQILATDRHLMIGSIMKKEFPGVSHQFDVWHVAKSITKKLTAKGKTKECEDLNPWIQSISNHLWWCCATCGGDETLLR